ncbi:hypothetical protein [uncultured Tateyamaria sp.]|uniref:hypothetical protein n=1 Tax=uncultured Tateyamaria sp. TaxID=455651 RepID=UPI0026101EE3|nr:hypothetical protein [uncultured Tateyamaria sp.]
MNEMLRNQPVLGMFNAYMIRNDKSGAAMLGFLTNTKVTGYKLFEEFLSKSAKTPIALDGKQQKAVDDVMRGPQKDAAAGLNKLVPGLKKACLTYLDKKAIPAFYKTKDKPGSVFYQHCRPHAEKNCEGRFGKIAVATKRLGLTDQMLVKEIMVQLYMGNNKSAAAAATKAAKKAGLKMPAVVIVDAVERQRGLIGYHDVKIDAKSLVFCGFQNVNDKDILKLMKQMVEHHYDKKDSKAKKAFEQIKKLEPKSSPITKLKYDAFIKLLKKKGTIT